MKRSGDTCFSKSMHFSWSLEKHRTYNYTKLYREKNYTGIPCRRILATPLPKALARSTAAGHAASVRFLCFR
jgi:hypothetical protein